MAAKKPDDNIEVSGSGLEMLLNRILKACEDDIAETEQNIAFYKSEVINNPLGKEQWGSMLGDALKIKGQARDRYIKCVNLFKDRVKMKEIMEKAQGNEDSPESLLRAIDKAFAEDDD
jgi:hypothetical protein